MSTYLKNLKFDPKLAHSFKAKYLTNIRIVILLVILIVAGGVVSFLTLPKRLNPEIKIPIVSVVTTLPGAPPKDVERLVTKPLEDSIHTLKGIAELDSSSSESVSVITIQFNSNINADKAKDDVQTAVDSVNTLPNDAKTPNVKKFDFEDQAVWTFSLRGKDPASQAQVAKRIKKALEDTPSLDRVVVSGLPTQEIQIIARPTALATYSINPLVLSQAIQRGLSSYPGGTVTTGNSAFPIGINARVNTIEDIRDTVLTLNGEQVRLGDVADVIERAAPNQKNAYYADSSTHPEHVVTFAVYKTTATTIDKGVNDAKQVVEKVLGEDKGFRIITVSDFSKDIDVEFGDLIANYRDTLILVFITFLIFLGVRQAVIAVLTIPLTFLVTFTVINAMGLSLNFLTLFSLLLSLGLLVDDTIVVVTGMTSYYRTNKFTPTEAGLLVWRDFIVPIWTTTITTVWAFVPLLLATGIIGEFIKSIPIVVTVTLYASTAIAVLITLPLMMTILKISIPRRVVILSQIILVLGLFFVIWTIAGGSVLTPFIILIFGFYLFIVYRTKKSLRKGFGKNFPFRFSFRKRLDNRLLDIEHFSQTYKRIILRILNSSSARKKVIFATITFVVFAFMLVPLGFVVNEFFPKSGTDFLFVNLEMPSGTNAQTTTGKALTLQESLRKTQGIAYTTLEVGNSANGGGGIAASSGGDNVAQVTLNLPEKKLRHEDSLAIAQKLRDEYKSYTSAKVTVVEQSGGPPAGEDISIRLLGDDLSKLDEITDKLTAYLNKQPGVINVQKSIKPGTSKLTFTPDSQKLAANGVSIDTAGLYLRMFASGMPIDDVTWNDEKTDIIFRTSTGIKTPEDAGALLIPGQNNEQIPLVSLGNLNLEANPTTIAHFDTKRVIGVSAGVVRGYSAGTINADLQKYANSLTLPDGYSFQTGGANEENQKSVASILQAMLLSALLIITTMVIQFRSYRKAAIVMSVIPVAISGVLVVFALTGTPLSFPALIGILSLFGIVVTHAMMLIDKINRNLSAGIPFNEALADGAASRLEPVFIGSFTTIVGLIPISLSNPLWRGLGGAIIAGLSFSGIIMLFLIPVIFYLVYHNDYRKQK